MSLEKFCGQGHPVSHVFCFPLSSPCPPRILCVLLAVCYAGVLSLLPRRVWDQGRKHTALMPIPLTIHPARHSREGLIQSDSDWI